MAEYIEEVEAIEKSETRGLEGWVSAALKFLQFRDPACEAVDVFVHSNEAVPCLYSP